MRLAERGRWIGAGKEGKLGEGMFVLVMGGVWRCGDGAESIGGDRLLGTEMFGGGISTEIRELSWPKMAEFHVCVGYGFAVSMRCRFAWLHLRVRICCYPRPRLSFFILLEVFRPVVQPCTAMLLCENFTPGVDKAWCLLRRHRPKNQLLMLELAPCLITYS